MTEIESNFEYSDHGYSVREPVSFFTLSLVNPNKIRLVNVGPDLVRLLQERLQRLVNIESAAYVILSDYTHRNNSLSRFNIYDLILSKNYFVKDSELNKEDMTIIKVAFCRIFGALFCFGYDIVISSDLAREEMHSTIFFKLRHPQDYVPLHSLSHKFICIAPHFTDSILLINIPKVAVEEILKNIHLTWSPGIKSKQTLADDERSVTVVISLKLCGHPWTQAYYNSGKNTIQSRQVFFELVKILSKHKWRLATNVNYSGSTDSLFFQWCPHMEPSGDENIKYFALILSRYDRLRCLNAPPNIQQVIRDTLYDSWSLGLLKVRDYHGTTEFKLGGCPWWAEGNDAVEARFFMSTLIGNLKSNSWEIAGTFDLTRHNHDKTTFLFKQCGRASSSVPHMCISFCKSNRIRLIVSSSEISEESELLLTTRLNETIKRNWISLGPRNYGKSIEWKLEGDPWDSEGLYSDQTRSLYLLCLLIESIGPLGWKLVASADISSKNLGDSHDRLTSGLGSKSEDVHTWFFLHDEIYGELETCKTSQLDSFLLPSSTSVPNIASKPKLSRKLSPFLHQPRSFTHHLSKSVPSVSTKETFGDGNETRMNKKSFEFSNLSLIYPSCSTSGCKSESLFLNPHSSSLLSSSSSRQCMANDRCQSRRKNFIRQSSAGSLPPSRHPCCTHDDGYKSDGDAVDFGSTFGSQSSHKNGYPSGAGCERGNECGNGNRCGSRGGAESCRSLYSYTLDTKRVSRSGRISSPEERGAGIDEDLRPRSSASGDRTRVHSDFLGDTRQCIRKFEGSGGYRSESESRAESPIPLEIRSRSKCLYSQHGLRSTPPLQLHTTRCHHPHTYSTHPNHVTHSSSSVRYPTSKSRLGVKTPSGNLTGNAESCSTVSSSSSASAPPDYATGSGSLLSTLDSFTGHRAPYLPSAPSNIRKNNELYYVGEFYG